MLAARRLLPHPGLALVSAIAPSNAAMKRMSLFGRFGLALLALGFAGAASAATFTVTSTADTSAAGTLRWAIGQANASAGADTIAFNIAGSGVRTIAPTSALPAITAAVTIDGATQAGYAGAPLIELSGASTPAGTRGLIVSAGSVVIRALTVNHFPNQGIRIDAGSGSQITDCWIGLNNAGNAAAGNATGIFVDGSASNTIGPGNTISGNTFDGVRLNGAGATGNVVRGNRIGTNPAGSGAIGNGTNGVVITVATGNTIGGSAAADANLISGNVANGVAIAQGASGNAVARNLIGTNLAGSAAIANAADGVLVVDSPGNTVGGAVAGTFNVISGNAGDGVEVRGVAAIGNIIQRNVIGLNIGGTSAVGDARRWLQQP
jgi:parallel beta-helix repeat protein